MPLLVLVNGAPGAGKSTVAAALAATRPMALALDVDAIKHALGAWDADAVAAGLQARRLALAVVHRHLADGYDVVLGQYLARPDFAEQLADAAAAAGARFAEVALVLPPSALAERLASRAAAPDRPEHMVNNALVAPEDAGVLADSLDRVLATRPGMLPVDATGGLPGVLARVRAAAGWDRLDA